MTETKMEMETETRMAKSDSETVVQEYTIVTPDGDVETISLKGVESWWRLDIRLKYRHLEHLSLEEVGRRALRGPGSWLVVGDGRCCGVFEIATFLELYDEDFFDVTGWDNGVGEKIEILDGLNERMEDLQNTVELSGDDCDQAAVQEEWNGIVRDAMEPLGRCYDDMNIINRPFIWNEEKVLFLKAYIQVYPETFKNLYDWCTAASLLTWELINGKPEFVTMESGVLEQLKAIEEDFWAGLRNFYEQHFARADAALPQLKRKRKSEARRLQEDAYHDPDVAAMSELTKGGIKTRRRFYKRE
jgi:hypothetical protein